MRVDVQLHNVPEHDQVLRARHVELGVEERHQRHRSTVQRRSKRLFVFEN